MMTLIIKDGKKMTDDRRQKQKTEGVDIYYVFTAPEGRDIFSRGRNPRKENIKPMEP
jgi:hypothetical protein